MKISLISISSPITEEQLAQLDKSLGYLRSLGLEPVYNDEIFSLEKRCLLRCRNFFYALSARWSWMYRASRALGL
jgi:hypothetical protein